MLQLALGEGDIAKGVRGNFQVVVLIAILLVLLGQWRTDAERKRPAAAAAAPPPCVVRQQPARCWQQSRARALPGALCARA